MGSDTVISRATPLESRRYENHALHLACLQRYTIAPPKMFKKVQVRS